MRSVAQVLALALLMTLKPACGASGLVFPAIPLPVGAVPASAVNHPDAAFDPVLLNGAAVDHTVDATPAVTDDAVIIQSLRTNLALGGKTLINTGGVPRTLKFGNTRIPISAATTVLDGGGLATLDGEGKYGMFDIAAGSTFTVQRLDFAHARSSQNGAAIDADYGMGVLSVIQCDFTDCQTTHAGPDRGGGAIRAWGTQHTRISNCTFDHCAASNGGAVNSLGSRLWIIECLFTQNVAFGTGGGGSGQGGIGGAVYVDNVSNIAVPYELVISGCVFNANAANAHAGGLFAYTDPSKTTSVTIIDGSTFAGNVAVSDNDAGGGGVYALNNTLTVTNSTFNANVSGSSGGGLRCDNDTVTITNCTFQGNQAGGLGGGILTFTAVSMTLLNVTVAQNHADGFGGGIHFETPVGSVNRCIFADNTAGNNGQGWHTTTSFASGGSNIQFPSLPLPRGKPITSSGTTIADPQLIGLAANGSVSSWTMALPSGSAARDLVGGSSAAKDQRGVDRDGTPDAGAFEYP